MSRERKATSTFSCASGRSRPNMATAVNILAVLSLVTVALPLGHAQQRPAGGEAKASGFTDPLFNKPYIDVDECRDKPVRHRYVHGGFKETAARFSFYFPPKDHYDGRFFQHITPAPSSENL